MNLYYEKPSTTKGLRYYQVEGYTKDALQLKETFVMSQEI